MYPYILNDERQASTVLFGPKTGQNQCSPLSSLEHIFFANFCFPYEV